YRVGLALGWGYGCGQGGDRTHEEMALELSVDEANRATLRAVGERRHNSWSRGNSATGREGFHHEERSAIDVTYTGRAKRAGGGLTLDLVGLPSQRLALTCQPADVAFQ